MSPAFVLTISLAAVGQSAPQSLVDLPSGSALKPVAAFHREATFVAKDRQLRFLDVTKPGEPKAVFQVNRLGDLNCPIALAAESRSVIVTDGRVIMQVNEKGAAVILVALKDIHVTPVGDAQEETNGSHSSIVWFFATSPSRKILYFALHRDDRQEMCRLDLDSKEMKTIRIPFAHGVDVDLETGTVYDRGESGAGRIIVKDFRGTPERRIPLSVPCDRCRLSPDRKHLLISNHDLDPHPRLALVELATGKESVLPVEGALATWGNDETLFFVRGSNSLWRYRLGATSATEVVAVRGNPAPGFAEEPQLSGDKTWLAWGWTIENAGRPKNGMILFDVESNEYRQLDGWWRNVRWLAAPRPAGKEE